MFTSEIKCPFSVKLLDQIEVKKGCWKVSKVGVFNGDEQIGEYTRNYDSHIKSTFFPFKQDDKWYALYSKDYTSTRLMSLPSCEDIGGETPKENGFCPVEFYVPEVTIQKIKYSEPILDQDRKWRISEKISENAISYRWPDDSNLEWAEYKNKHNADWEKWMSDHPFVTEHAKFGFVAGCHWGDDTSWKVRFVDLSKAKDGIITIDDRFGYIELPPKVKLVDAVDVQQETDQEDPKISIALPIKFSINGKAIDAEF